jgi:hypothetical protein
MLFHVSNSKKPTMGQDVWVYLPPGFDKHIEISLGSCETMTLGTANLHTTPSQIMHKE